MRPAPCEHHSVAQARYEISLRRTGYIRSAGIGFVPLCIKQGNASASKYLGDTRLWFLGLPGFRDSARYLGRASFNILAWNVVIGPSKIA